MLTLLIPWLFVSSFILAEPGPRNTDKLARGAQCCKTLLHLSMWSQNEFLGNFQIALGPCSNSFALPNVLPSQIPSVLDASIKLFKIKMKTTVYRMRRSRWFSQRHPCRTQTVKVKKCTSWGKQRSLFFRHTSSPCLHPWTVIKRLALSKQLRRTREDVRFT